MLGPDGWDPIHMELLGNEQQDDDDDNEEEEKTRTRPQDGRACGTEELLG